MYETKAVLALFLLFISANALSGQPPGSVYIDGGDKKNGVILAHGKGKHPTWLVVDPLRKGINDKLGYHTLSLQMPTGYSDWKDYAKGFPDAFSAINEAISFLKNEKGVTRIFLLGHSMGSRMSSAFVAENPNQDLSGLILVGCRNNGGHPLACDKNLQGIKIPVLDIWGGNNPKDSTAASERASMASDTYRQLEIPGANHTFEGYEDKLVEAVVSWLKEED